LVYYGIIVLILSFVAIIGGRILVGSMTMAASSGPVPVFSNRDALLLITAIGGGGVLLGGLLNFIGQIVCCMVPSQSGAKGYAIGAVVMQVCAVGLYFANIAHTVMAGPSPYLPFAHLTNAAGLIGTVLFVLFMRKLSSFIGRGDLRRRSGNILVFGAILLAIFGLLLLGFVIWKAELFGWLSIVLLIGGLVCFVMYANLINALRKVLLGKVALSKKMVLLSPRSG
jgi:hypothetical protein